MANNKIDWIDQNMEYELTVAPRRAAEIKVIFHGPSPKRVSITGGILANPIHVVSCIHVPTPTQPAESAVYVPNGGSAVVCLPVDLAIQQFYVRPEYDKAGSPCSAPSVHLQSFTGGWNPTPPHEDTQLGTARIPTQTFEIDPLGPDDIQVVIVIKDTAGGGGPQMKADEDKTTDVVAPQVVSTSTDVTSELDVTTE